MEAVRKKIFNSRFCGDNERLEVGIYSLALRKIINMHADYRYMRYCFIRQSLQARLRCKHLKLHPCASSVPVLKEALLQRSEMKPLVGVRNCIFMH
jgi:hypothetical protein